MGSAIHVQSDQGKTNLFPLNQKQKNDDETLAAAATAATVPPTISADASAGPVPPTPEEISEEMDHLEENCEDDSSLDATLASLQIAELNDDVVDIVLN